MTSTDKLIEDVIKWAHDKGILRASNATLQMSKTLEECAEVLRELHAPEPDDSALDSEYGDVLVTLIIGMELAGVDPNAALYTAYNKISKRKGSIVDGVFVKEAG
jgi:NTP pyrophosphatase (non-canonical NTP hydrolase)